MRVNQQPPPRALRFPMPRDATTGVAPFPRSTRPASPARALDTSAHQWLVDLGALYRCRQLFARQSAGELQRGAADSLDTSQSLLDVPPAYDVFCRTHFASVRRLHPELTWEDACPAYAIALSAHAVLCVALDDEREQALQDNWERIRGTSTLAWEQARPLIADGCSALARIDPLAMQR